MIKKYQIIKNKEELSSTDYIEIIPGKFRGKYWQKESLFVNEDYFLISEMVICKHMSIYDRYAINNIPREIGEIIIKDWEFIATSLLNKNIEAVFKILNKEEALSIKLELEENTELIIKMLLELIKSCELFYQNCNWICVIGL